MTVENKICIRCGTCCDANALSFIKREDIDRWKAENRIDIFEIIENNHFVWAGDRCISSTNGHHIHTCPFLEIKETFCECAIYETRPLVCVSFKPGSSALCPVFY